MKNPPLGIRNNNPGNIRASQTKWMGEMIVEGAFERFETPVMGLRALMRLLLIYYRRYELDSIRSIVNRWAPPNENDTGAYQVSVTETTGYGVDDRLCLDDENVLILLAKAIVRHENGVPPKSLGRPPFWYADADFAQAATLALSA